MDAESPLNRASTKALGFIQATPALDGNLYTGLMTLLAQAIAENGANGAQYTSIISGAYTLIGALVGGACAILAQRFAQSIVQERERDTALRNAYGEFGAAAYRFLHEGRQHHALLARRDRAAQRLKDARVKAHRKHIEQGETVVERIDTLIDDQIVRLAEGTTALNAARSRLFMLERTAHAIDNVNHHTDAMLLATDPFAIDLFSKLLPLWLAGRAEDLGVDLSAELKSKTMVASKLADSAANTRDVTTENEGV